MNTIRVEQRVCGPLEALWQACSEPETLACWQADTVHGAVVPGGRLRMSWPALGVRIALEVTEVVKERRIVLKSGPSRVELDFEEGAIRLTHMGLRAGDESEGTESSWRLALAQLAHYLEHHRGRRRHVHWVVRSLRVQPEAAHVFFTEQAALASWLTRPGTSRAAIGEPGSHFSLVLASGKPISGRVLTNTSGRDVALSWHEDENSVLSFRTLPEPGSDGRRLVMLMWSRWRTATEKRHEGTEPVLAELGASLARLASLVDSPGQA